MKRVNQLQPLSRQHHLGLSLSTKAKKCTNDSEQIKQHWQALIRYIEHDMASHFDLEDDLLVSALLPHQSQNAEVQQVLATLEAQHQQLHQLITQGQRVEQSNQQPDPQLKQQSNQQPNQQQVIKLATALYEHIRFEERQLFPLAQSLLTTQQLEAIYNASDDNVKKTDEHR